jgi:hypothetical protein
MRHSLLVASSISLAAAAQSAPAPIPLSPDAQKDVLCFMLNAAAAGNPKNKEAQTAGGLGMMYYLGRLDVHAPGLDLARAVRQEAKVLETPARAKAIGQACDSESKTRGQQLLRIGAELQKPQP